MSSDWDVDSYRTDHESNDHWELRKKFMLAHKDKFSEEELVCLAQVFTNIEFLGCRYPAPTMVRVAELAKGVVENFREQRKNSLKRTFVAASDAASSKIKGSYNRGHEYEPSKKIKKTNLAQDRETTQAHKYCDNPTKTGSSEVSTRLPKYGGVKTFNIKTKNELDSKSSKPLGNFVLFLTPGENSINDLCRSAAINSVVPRWEFDNGVGCMKICKFYLNDVLVASRVGENMKSIKESTAVAAISKLRETYFSVQVKCKFSSDTIVSSSQINSQSCESEKLTGELGEDNVGRKLMKLMGWGGGGLGVKEQGIEEPVEAALQVQRRGLGHTENDSNFQQFRKNATEYLKKWLNNDSKNDLVFATEFSSDERKVIHEVARKFNLKSKSYGKDGNRCLVVSRKVEPWEIVETLKETGGTSEKYELLYPTKDTKNTLS
ncbi:hypothetical protein RUM43_013852 [Polyplax serrata]|uniref:NF-kappa-B-repressing factor n=1 Tax=Polyplax serrata TaxID=468196 RepID=A0AAN8PH19_POLSC